MSINHNETESSGRNDEGLEFELKHEKRKINGDLSLKMFPKPLHNTQEPENNESHKGRSHSVNQNLSMKVVKEKISFEKKRNRISNGLQDGKLGFLAHLKDKNRNYSVKIKDI